MMFGHTPADQGEPDLDALLRSMRLELREGGSGTGHSDARSHQAGNAQR
jgi:hypothetical protein